MPKLLVVLLAVAAAGCTAGGEERADRAQPTTPTTAVPATTTTWTIPLPPGFTGTGDVVNVHIPVLLSRPGQTAWSHTASNGLTLTVRIDRATPKANEPVTFEVVLSSATLACCGLELRPGDGTTLTEGGGFACVPAEAAQVRVATFRRAHVYERAGRFMFGVMARAGTCSEPPALAGFSAVIEIP